MRRLVYRPEIEILIRSAEDNKVYDVSDDVTVASVTRRLNALSTASFTLQNRGGRYTYLFKPMDVIAIFMTRINRQLVFTGYLDTTPLYQRTPGTVNFEASCTLKLLQNTYFDPGLPFMMTFFNSIAKGKFSYDPTSGALTSTGATFGDFDINAGWATVLRAVLTAPQLGGWAEKAVHITGLPQSFLENFASAYLQAGKDAQAQFASLVPAIDSIMNGGSDSTIDGPNIPTNFNTGATGTQFAKALAKTTKRLSKLQLETAGVVFEQAKTFGKFSDLVSIGLVASTYGECSLIPNSHGSGGTGLFGLTSDVYFGSSGYLAQAVRTTTKSYSGSPQNQTGDPIATNPVYATRAFILSVKGDPHTKEIEKSSEPYKLIVKYWERPYDKDAAVPGDVQRAEPLWPELVKALSILSAQKSTAPNLLPPDPFADTNSEANSTRKSKAKAKNSSTNQKEQSHRQTLVDQAYKEINVPYRWAGSTEAGGFDCSGLIQFLYSKIGVSLPHYSGNKSTEKGQWGEGTEVKNPQPGDLAFPIGEFNNGGDPQHVGIYVGNDTIIEAPHTGENVKTISTTSFGGSKGVRYRSLLGTDSVSVTTPSGIAGGDQTSNSLLSQAEGQLGVFTENLQSVDSTLSITLTGNKALANDINLFDWFQTMTTAGGRSFCSLPNGDFYAFFPDYFGEFGDRTAYYVIQDIEIIDFDISISDKDLSTHVFTTGTLVSFSDSISEYDRLLPQVASVAEPAFSVFINPISSATGKREQFDPGAFLKRYGARPFTYDLPEVRHPLLLWMAAWMKFAELWAGQCLADVQLTFMPELFPGGLISIDNEFTMFIEEVTHSIDRQNGFTTDVTLSAPSAHKKEEQQFGSLVLPNEYKDAQKYSLPSATKKKGHTEQAR